MEGCPEMNHEDLWVFLSGDGSQIEIRFLAEVSGDPLLIHQFNTGQDIHCLVGSTLTNYPVERIKTEKNLRKIVKNLHFGIVYGKGRNGIYEYVVALIRKLEGSKADLTGITKLKTERLFDAYFRKYTGVTRYIDAMRRMVEELGYVETIYGFRRDVRQDDDERSSFWGNIAINTPIQASAHQYLLVCMALLHMKPVTYSLLQEPSMEIHDQLVFLVRLRNLAEAYKQFMQLFQEGAMAYTLRHFKRKIRVPLLAEAEAGFCLGSLVSYTGEPVDQFLPVWRKKQVEVDAKSWSDL
jgi:DNA polymerase-1